MSETTPECPSWLETLYRAQAAGLVLYGRALGLSHSEAEDVLQEMFIKLMKLRECPRQPEFYCLRAYRNHAFNLRRGFLRRIAREFESKRWFERGPDKTPLERAAMKALRKLPAPQREVIVLKFWRKLTFEQIGALLDISPNTAAGRYRYGIDKLRQQLSHEPRTAFPYFVSLEAASALGGD